MEPKKEKSAKVIIRMPEEFRHRMKEKALRQRKSVQWVVTDLLVKWLREDERQ